MIIFETWFLIFPFLLFFDEATSECDHRERSLSYLDVAVDMISKAKRFLPICPTNELKPADCKDVLEAGHNESGVYTIWPRSRVTQGRGLEVFCDMDTDNGGWTVIQRRGKYLRSNEYFFKEWASYKKGFGNIKEDFWLGNDNIFALTNQGLYSIRFDLKALDGQKRYALYDVFWIDDERNKYSINIKDYRGDAGDSINEKHDGQKFSTKDQDNDNDKERNCAQLFKGGWWYNACHDSNLNGLYLYGEHDTTGDGVNWKAWKGHKESLIMTEMKIRPKDFRKMKYDIS